MFSEFALKEDDVVCNPTVLTSPVPVIDHLYIIYFIQAYVNIITIASSVTTVH